MSGRHAIVLFCILDDLLTNGDWVDTLTNAGNLNYVALTILVEPSAGLLVLGRNAKVNLERQTVGVVNTVDDELTLVTNNLMTLELNGVEVTTNQRVGSGEEKIHHCINNILAHATQHVNESHLLTNLLTVKVHLMLEDVNLTSLEGCTVNALRRTVRIVVHVGSHRVRTDDGLNLLVSRIQTNVRIQGEAHLSIGSFGIPLLGKHIVKIHLQRGVTTVYIAHRGKALSNKIVKLCVAYHN